VAINRLNIIKDVMSDSIAWLDVDQNKVELSKDDVNNLIGIGVMEASKILLG
jgi:hypothetical protein